MPGKIAKQTILGRIRLNIYKNENMTKHGQGSW